jgi:hypothetical protein
VKDSPTYDAAVALSREYEESLYKHHARTGYWADEGYSLNQGDAHR